MSVFRQALAAVQPRSRRHRRWIFVPYDQLTDRCGPLAEAPPEELGVVVVEAPAKAARRPYHQQKLALVLANLRHFALEQAARGVAVRHVVSSGDYASALASLVRELGPLTLMEPAERELRTDIAELVERGALQIVAHAGWLTTPAQFAAACPQAPYRMDAFYRQVRRDSGILMTRGKPTGGRFSFDGENRQPWRPERGDADVPTPPTFSTHAITEEVIDLVRTRYADHPGRIDALSLPATAADAERAWTWARTQCLPHFGPFEDAMSTRSRGLFHTRIAALLNLHRLLPAQVLADVLAADLPLPSREGFVRQVLGWREFVRHVHRATDGFRTLAADGAPSLLGAQAALPPVFWGGCASGLHCLDSVVSAVWDEAYSHHITRLMVLGNIATMLGVAPRALTDWFWVAYADAFDWVVEPNVLAMATFGAGDVMTTKPYVCGAAYINRMSDYCRGCAFDPKRNCPITALYWDFLHRHSERFARNPRLAQMVRAAQARSITQREADRARAEQTRAALAQGDLLRPG